MGIFIPDGGPNPFPLPDDVDWSDLNLPEFLSDFFWDMFLDGLTMEEYDAFMGLGDALTTPSEPRPPMIPPGWGPFDAPWPGTFQPIPPNDDIIWA
jgi:hypothetical protein